MAKGFKTTWVPTPPNWQKLKHHPFACVVEFGAGIDLDSMAAHMREHGYDESEPVVLYIPDTKKPPQILAGRHRHHAAQMAGVEPVFRVLEGDEAKARAFAMKDIHRRHLSVSQRAMIAAALAPLKPGANQYTEVGGKTPTSQAEAAKTLGVSVDAVKDAKKVTDKGVPELVKAVTGGVLAVTDAAAVAGLPEKDQKAAVADVLAGKARTAKSAARKRADAKKPLKNGAACPTYQEMAATLGPLIRILDVFFKFHKRKDGVEHLGLRRRLDEFTKQLRADHKKFTKVEA